MIWISETTRGMGSFQYDHDFFLFFFRAKIFLSAGSFVPLLLETDDIHR